MIIIFLTISDNERRELGELIVAIARGDEGALAAVYQRAGGRLLSVAMGLTRDIHSAQDVLHDSFIKVARSAHQFKRGTNGYAWLCKIVKNTAINKIKSENIRRGLDIDSFFNLSDGQDMAEKSDTAATVETALKALLPKERTVIWLRYYNDMTVREIAAELSMPKSTVHETLKAAEAKLKKALAPSDKMD
jgi:RNA polymerase sigma factor (sigma-70 family)